MVPSAASVTLGVSSFLGSLLLLYMNVPRTVLNGGWMHFAPSAQIQTSRPKGEGLEVTATVEGLGRGTKRVTLRLNFGEPPRRSEDEGL